MNFFKKLFGNGKIEEEKPSGIFVVATLNDKVMPIDRGEIYEDPLDEFLQANKIGEVTGGGTMQLKTGELEYCDIEIQLTSDNIDENHIQAIIGKLEELGAPKGSKLTIEKTDQEIEFGKKEGLGIYLDGVNLSPEVYQNSDINYVVSEIKKLMNDQTETVRFWEGEQQTRLYFYSDSYELMKEDSKPFLATYPLCKGALVERIA